MTDEEKSQNRWKMAKAVLAYLAIFGLGMFTMAALGNVEGVAALTGLAYGLLAFAGGLLGVNLATPAGGFKK